jgi:hypothetical protein
MPSSSSFPSGHAASAFAFSYAVGRHLPELAVPIRLLAGAVAYSRVHIGVHYPGDVAVGSMIGSGIAAMVASVGDRVAGRRRRAEAPSRGHPRRSSPSANSAAWARYSTKLTLVTSGPLKLVPWIVTEVPTGPPAGENELIVGAAAKAASAPGRATRIPISKNVADISPARLRTVLIMTNSPHHQKEPNHLNFQSYAPSHRGN